MGNRFETPGAFSWVELMTSDPEAAKQFYGALFGWEMTTSPMAGTDYTVVKVAGEEVAGMMKMPPTVPAGVPPHWTAYVTVADVDAAVAKAQQLGGAVLHPPTDIPGVGRFAVLQDPQGAAISVIKYAMKPPTA